MADNTVVHIGENSPEEVAFKLMQTLLVSVEGKSWSDLDRKQYLTAYADCLRVVRGARPD